MELVPCDGCGSMRVHGGCTCPHCGASKCAKRPASAITAALLLGLADCVADPPGGGNEPPYGLSVIDRDQDGFFAPGEDCDDDNADINPDAGETPGDDVDSNCDGEDDT